MALIYSRFNNLKQEKKERIINAALKEFSQNGYEKASTNEIIKEAGISKGSLFNYFNSKKELYLFLFDYANEIIEKIYNEVDWNETDFFERMRQIMLVKLKVYKKYPYALDFLVGVTNENADEVKPEVDTLKKELTSSFLKRGYQNINFSKFREDIDLEKMINIINWTILSFAEELRDKEDSSKDTMGIRGEWDEYFDILKQCFYKNKKQ